MICACRYLLGDRPQACIQMTLSRAERQFCVCDLFGPTAGERSVSAPGHPSGFVNFLHTASQLLSPPNTDFSRGSLEVEIDYKKIQEVDLLHLNSVLFLSSESRHICTHYFFII